MTVRGWIVAAENRLKSAEIASPSLEAQLLAADALGVDRVWLFAHPEAEFPDPFGNELLERRLSGEPLAYILGWRDFYGRRFSVDPAVLIPRQETETLIEAALATYPAHPNPVDLSQLSVLDMGVGSGILAISLKLERPDWEITGVDLSPDALTTASANAKFHQASIKWVLSDGFEALLGESYDLIVSNPPYIGRSEELAREVRAFEPDMALFAEKEGLAFYEMLAEEAPGYLRDEGLLLVEVGHRQAEAVTGIFRSQGWNLFKQYPDLSGVTRVLGWKHAFDCQVDH